MGGHPDAQDVAQQALLQAWAKLDTFRGGDFRAWLFTIARRLVIDSYRLRRESQHLDASAPLLAESHPALQTPPDTIQVMCDCRARLDSWVDCLTRRLRLEEQVAVLLADIHSYRDKESAAALGISLASFKLLLHHARGRLRAIAGGHCALADQARPPCRDAAPDSCRCNADRGAACRLGIKCARRVPMLLALRDRLVTGLRSKN